MAVKKKISKTKSVFAKKPQLLLAAVLAVALLIFVAWNSVTAPIPVPLTDEEILARLANFPEVQPYVVPGYSTTIAKFSQEEIAARAQTQPVIYGNITAAEVYVVLYKGPTDSLLVLYDEQADEILRTFRVTDLTIGS